MLGQLEAILKSPPAAAGGTAASRPFATTVAATGSAVVPVTTLTAADGAVIPYPLGCFITWISDTDCYIRVGDSTISIATTSDWFLPAGVAVDWWHNGQTQTHFSVIQKTTGGTIKRYRSSI
jgi:hypothetical protein